MKKFIKYIILLVILLFVVFGVFILTTKDKDTDAVKFKEEYESLNGKKSSSGKIYPQVNITKDNNVVYAEYEDLFEILDSGTGIIFFGFPECPWCRNALPVLLNAAKEYDDLTIYYMNMLDKRDIKEVDDDGNIKDVKEATSNYKKLLKYLDNYLDEYTLVDKDKNIVHTGEKRIYVPLVVFVKDGNIIGVHSDTVSSQEDPYVALTKEQKSELREIYLSFIDELFTCNIKSTGC